jgi:hypothetical protein
MLINHVKYIYYEKKKKRKKAGPVAIRVARVGRVMLDAVYQRKEGTY